MHLNLKTKSWFLTSEDTALFYERLWLISKRQTKNIELLHDESIMFCLL